MDYFDIYKSKTPKSKKAHEKALDLMPGGICHNLRYHPPYPICIKDAYGSKIVDVDENVYIDLWMGHYAHILGHRPDIVYNTVKEEGPKGLHWGFVHPAEIEFAEMIKELIPCAEKIRFCCTGTEATMYAVRFARAFTGRNVILKMAGGWHGGNSDLSLYIKPPFDKEDSAGLLPEATNYCRPLFFNDLDRSYKIIKETGNDLAGIILEPVMGNGFIPGEAEYLNMLREETKRLNALLIFDEIITGFRVGVNGAQGLFGIIPDLATFGKVAGGGMHLGIIAGRADILSLCDPTIKRENKWDGVLSGGGTFSCNPLAMEVGKSVVSYLKKNEKDIYPELADKGEKMRKGIKQAFDDANVDAIVTGFASLFQTHFPLKKDDRPRNPHEILLKTDINKREVEFKIRMLNHGVNLMHGGGAISTAHTDKDIEKVIEAAREVAVEMRGE